MNSTIICNTQYGVHTSDYLSNIVLNFNIIQDNGKGIHNEGTYEINAEKNYWGSPDGPGGQGSGCGNNVSDNVDFEPWYATNSTSPLRELVQVTYDPIRAFSDTVQGGIDAASNNDTVRVSAGIYYENIIVNKSLNIFGNGSINSIIDGRNNISAILITANHVNISGFTIINTGRSAFAGIYIEANYTKIYKCNISNKNNKNGIFLFNNTGNEIFDNICLNNNRGILLIGSNNNIIRNNTIIENSDGIQLAYSSNYNIILNNTCISL